VASLSEPERALSRAPNVPPRPARGQSNDANQEPLGAAGGADVDLVLIDGEWFVIGGGAWIT
jgi:hypothetical protein